MEQVLGLVEDGDDPIEELSDDEDLVGDFVSSSGHAMLFSDTLHRDSVEGEELVTREIVDPCFRSSLLLLDDTLTEVNTKLMLHGHTCDISP